MATAQQIINVAKAELGVTENPVGSNNVKYNTEYYGGAVSGTSYPWCAVFLWWVFKHANASSLFCGGQKTAAVQFIYNYYNGQGRVYSTPKPGDLAIITPANFGHTGLVISVSGNSYTTIEGNSSDRVKQNNRTLGDGTVFCRPAYSGGSTGGSDTDKPTLSYGSNGSDVKVLQKKLMLLGYDCGESGADGDFGSGTQSAVKKFQSDNGLAVDGICGANTHAKLDAKYKALGVFVAVCNLQDLKVRTGPGTNYSIFSKYPSLDKGEEVKVGRTTSNNWYFAFIGRRYVAYMAAKYMKKK